MCGDVPSLGERDRNEQDDGPEAEHDLDLAKEVKHLGDDAWNGRASAGASPRVVFALDGVGQRGEPRRRKRVEDGEQEDRRRDGVERLRVNPRAKHVEEPFSGCDGGVRAEQWRKCWNRTDARDHSFQALS